MTASTARLARIVRVRDRQQWVADVQLAKAETELAGIDTTFRRVAAFRHDFAPQVARIEGHEMRALGEFGIRLDGLEAMLEAKRTGASESKAIATATRLAAWRDHRAISNLHDRATIADANRAEDRMASQMPHRVVPKRGGGR